MSGNVVHPRVYIRHIVDHEGCSLGYSPRVLDILDQR